VVHVTAPVTTVAPVTADGRAADGRATIRRLLELVIGPPGHTESEIVQKLAVELHVVRNRLLDLKRRGILVGPMEQEGQATWRSWFPTLEATLAGVERSGLRTNVSVLPAGSWWDAIWSKNRV
jgi:hypothetical protein